MSGYAVAQRRMQFCAGPETHVFEACLEHLPLLEAGDVSCFLVLKNEPVEPVLEEDEVGCWFCREG